MRLLKLSPSIPHLGLLLALTFCLTTPGLAWADEGDEDKKEDEGSQDDDSEELPPWAEEGDNGDDSKDDDDDDDDDSVGAEMGDSTVMKSEADAADTPAIPADQWKTGGMLGLGFSIGTSNGLSMKIWANRMHGIVLTLGAPLRLNSVAVGLSYRIHPKAISVPGSTVRLHPNLGPAFRARVFGYTDGAFVDGLGGLAVGLSATIADVPAEFFLDVIPGVTFGINIPGTGVGFDVAGRVGARLYL